MTQTETTNELLASLQHLGDGAAWAEQIYSLVGHPHFFSDFSLGDIKTLASFMQIYRAGPGETIIREGDDGDFMLFIIEGRVDIFKNDHRDIRQHMTSVGAGTTLGEMSMIDGEPRFATCIATEPTLFAVLLRDAMIKIVQEQPALGAKILIKLVTLLSQRLRQTSTKLLDYMEK